MMSRLNQRPTIEQDGCHQALPGSASVVSCATIEEMETIDRIRPIRRGNDRAPDVVIPAKRLNYCGFALKPFTGVRGSEKM